jgi:hypothetical protein
MLLINFCNPGLCLFDSLDPGLQFLLGLGRLLQFPLELIGPGDSLAELAADPLDFLVVLVPLLVYQR